MKLTIYFDGSFWCGLVEYESIQGDYRASKYVFGPEPKDKEVEDFIYFKLQKLITRNDEKLNNHSVSIKADAVDKKINLKKMQRKINKEKRRSVVSTKAQLAMTESREQMKKARKKRSRIKKERLKKKKFELKQKKKMEKKKGH